MYQQKTPNKIISSHKFYMQIEVLVSVLLVIDLVTYGKERYFFLLGDFIERSECLTNDYNHEPSKHS